MAERNLNRFIATGRLGRDCEQISTKTQKTLTKFSIALANQFSDDVSWLNCVMWGEIGATLAPFLKKGKRVAIVGKLASRAIKDANGIVHHYWDCTVDELVLLSPIGEGQTSAKPKAKASIVEDDDTPF